MDKVKKGHIKARGTKAQTRLTALIVNELFRALHRRFSRHGLLEQLGPFQRVRMLVFRHRGIHRFRERDGARLRGN